MIARFAPVKDHTAFSFRGRWRCCMGLVEVVPSAGAALRSIFGERTSTTCLETDPTEWPTHSSAADKPILGEVREGRVLTDRQTLEKIDLRTPTSLFHQEFRMPQ